MQYPSSFERAMAPVGAAVTYCLSLQAMQVAGRACRVSCATRGWSSVLGCLVVCSSSLAAGQASYAIQRYLTQGPGRPEDFIISKSDAAFTVITGLVAFKIFGGQFCNLMPSHVCHQGALANFSLQGGPNYASAVQRENIEMFFLRDGCHHCGKRSGGSIADHIPPSMIVKAIQEQKNRGFWVKLFNVPTTPSQQQNRRGFWVKLFSTVSQQLRKRGFLAKLPKTKMTPQRFYPQCESCMQRQSEFLTNGKDPFVFHWKRGIPKPSHLSGLLLGAFTYEGHSSKSREKRSFFK